MHPFHQQFFHGTAGHGHRHGHMNLTASYQDFRTEGTGALLSGSAVMG